MASSRRRRWSLSAGGPAGGTVAWYLTVPGVAVTVRCMGSPVVRRLWVDLERPFARRWNGGDAFRSAYFNALSMSFPVGEQFFIDSVRAGAQALPAARRADFD